MKKGKKGFKKSWIRLLFGLLALVFVLVILFRFAELKEIAFLLKKVSYGWLLIAIALQFVFFALLAFLYKLILAEKKMSFFVLFRTVIAMLFVDYALPSFSASGCVLLYHVSRKKARKEKSALLIGLNVFLNLFFLLLILILGSLYLLKKSTKWAFSITFFSILLFLLCRIVLTERGRAHFKAVLSFLLQKWPKAKKRVASALKNFYEAKRGVTKKKFLAIFGITFLSYVFRISVICAIFLSFGVFVNPLTIAVGFAIAMVISTLSYIRIGVYEAGMTGAYSMLGIEYNLALTTTLLYRAVSFWLPFFLGFLLFRTLVKRNS